MILAEPALIYKILFGELNLLRVSAAFIKPLVQNYSF